MHLSNVHNQTEFDQKEMGIGDIIRFNYGGKRRYVLVLNPSDNRGLMHSLVLEKVSPSLLYVIKFMVGANVDIDPQTVYTMYISKNLSFKRSDSYRTFDITKVGKVEVLDYKFGYGGKDKLGGYPAVRDFTESEYITIAYEYFNNPFIKNGKFPGLANTPKEFIAELKEANIETLEKMHLAVLEHSAAPAVLSAPDPLRTAMNWAKRNGETMGRIKDIRIDMSNGQPMPPAVIIAYEPDNRFLLSGDVRLCVGISKGYSLSVKVLHYDTKKKEEKERKEAALDRKEEKEKSEEK